MLSSGCLELIIVQLLKLNAWPESDAANHWRAEIIAFQGSATRRFTPSMRQRIRLADAYRNAVRLITALNGGTSPVAWPTDCPCTLDELLGGEPAALETRLSSIPPG